MSKTAFLCFLIRLTDPEHSRRVVTGIKAKLLANKEDAE